MKRVLATSIALLVLSTAVYGQGALKVNNSTLALQLTAGELATFKTVNGLGGSGTGDAVLADANAFTGNNSFAGTSLFTGVPTIDAANEVKLSLTSDYDTFYLSAGTNTVSPQIDHTFLTLGHNIESTDAGLVPIVGTKPGWGLTLENNYLSPTSGSLQTEFYFGTANSERLMVGGIAASATASVTSVVANGSGSIVTISSPTYTPNYLRAGMRFYFTALPGTASGIDTTTAYKVKTVIDATSFNLGTSATTPVAITGATYSGAAGTMNRGGWGSTSFYQPTSILLDATYGSTLKSPDIRDSTAFEVSVNLAGKHNYSYFTNGQASYGSYLALYGDANTEGWVMGAEPNVGFKIYRNAPTFGNNAMVIDFSNNIGFGNAAPLARLNPTSTTEQLRLSYNDSNYAPFTVSSGGALTIAPSGGATTITGTLAATSLSGSGASLTSIPITALTSTTSAQMRTLVSDENGTGALLFSGATSPVFTTPQIDRITASTGEEIFTNGGKLFASGATESLDWNALELTGVWQLNNQNIAYDGASPNFVSVELGASATDTTFTRVSAGVAAIEGSNILTDAIAAGGTKPWSGTTLGASDLFTQTRSGLGSTTPAYGATTAVSALLTNSTAATVGTTVQIAPALRWHGSAWKSSATAAAQDHEWQAYVLPATGAASTTSKWALQSSNNGGAFADKLLVNTAGGLEIPTTPSSASALAVKIGNFNSGFYESNADVFATYNGAAVFRWSATSFYLPGSTYMGFSSGSIGSTSPDVTWSRSAAGELRIGTTGANALGSLLLTNITASGNLTVGSGGTAMALVKHGSDTLSAGTTGAVSATWITTGTRFICTGQGTTASGHLAVTIVNGTSYQIDSSNGSDARTVTWIAVKP